MQRGHRNFATSLWAGLLLAGLGAGSASALEKWLPRGPLVCYGGPAQQAQNATFALVRITRPERFQAYDAAQTRMVRIVINFVHSKTRLEDTATCRQRNGEVVCASTSCEGAVFTLLDDGQGKLKVRFETEIPRALWSCSADALRDMDVRASDRIVPVERGTGACIPPGWDQTD